MNAKRAKIPVSQIISTISINPKMEIKPQFSVKSVVIAVSKGLPSQRGNSLDDHAGNA